MDGMQFECIQACAVVLAAVALRAAVPLLDFANDMR